MRRLVAPLLVLALAGLAVAPASAAPDPDYTGIGRAPWASSFFRDPAWVSKMENGRCSGLLETGCRWFYNDYRLNCLPAATPGPAIQILSVRLAGVPVERTYVARYLKEVQSQFRAAASVFAASISAGFVATDPAVKGLDRTPRFVTADVNGSCEVAITHVEAPKEVLFRPPLQAQDSGDRTKQGLLPWLESQGFDEPNRRYFVLVDFTTMRLLDVATSWLRAPKIASTLAAAIDLQNPGILWGPYGSGRLDDVDTSPGPENFCNRGGVLGYVNLWPSLGRYFVDKKTDQLAKILAHELGHTFCQNHLAPHVGKSDAHVTDYEDIMGGPRRANQCGSRLAETRFLARFDCAHDDYWAQSALTTQAAWAGARWASSNSEYLWGAPKSATQTEFFSLQAINIDCKSLGYCYD